MNSIAKRFVVVVAVVSLVTLLCGCQSESTTPTPPAKTSAATSAGGPMGGPAKPSTSQMSTGLSAAPSGVDTSLKGGMK